MTYISRMEVHSHTEYSNIRLLDSINKPKALIDKAIEIGLNGIAITDHDALCGHIKINKYAQELFKDHPGFKVALGNEIYLCKTRDSGQKYYHFILIAKNSKGYKALKELSSRAWLNSYNDRGMERVVTLYDDLEEIVNKYPNSLIATSACLGGQLSSTISKLIDCEKMGDENSIFEQKKNIKEFMDFCKRLFENDFYIECAPACSKEQIAVNKRLKDIAKVFDCKMVIGSDTHYLSKEERYIHEAYLNSKGGEREVASFYEYAYLQTEEEIIEHLKESYDEDHIKEMFDNSMKIYDKIENFSLKKHSDIPKVEVKNYEKSHWWVEDEMDEYPVLKSMFESDDKMERYWINECWKGMKEKTGYWKDNKNYVAELEEEARVKRIIGEKLQTNMFRYPVLLQHYIDMIWDSGSTVGIGRGSSCSALNHLYLGITQLDPIKWNFPFFRYMNDERVELGDIDIDVSPSKRPVILRNIKEERSKNFISTIDEMGKKELGCTLVATFKTETSKSAILTACRGYRSEEFPNGIDVDIAQYIASLIPVERGFVFPLRDVMYGNENKGRKPIKSFQREVENYEGLFDIMLGIEGLISGRSSHASGVILFDEDPYEQCCFMRTPKGEVITQWDLHDAEYAGLTKLDLLVTDVQDKLTETIRLLQEHNEIDPNLSLREAYDKYLHPDVLPIDKKDVWKNIQEGKILNLFQFEAGEGLKAIQRGKPNTIQELRDLNGEMRLLAEKGIESSIDRYVRMKKDLLQWYKEMNDWGLTEEEQKIIEPYFKPSYGTPPSQEQLMLALMDKDICNFTLAEANTARKVVGKKIIDRVPEIKAMVFEKGKSKRLSEYIWKFLVAPQMSYAFSVIHATAYAYIAYQSAYLATKWNPIYWNTACLIVNSGSLEENIEETEDTKKKVKTTDYAKVAKALIDILTNNIKISLVDINKSEYSFEPNAERGEILFGLKALSHVGDEQIELIKNNRPFVSFKDFLNRCSINRPAIRSLIKAGAFDNLEKDWADKLEVEPRQLVMAYFTSISSEPKSKLTLQNLNGLIQKDLIPENLNFGKAVYAFNKFLKAHMKNGDYYELNDFCLNFIYGNNIEISDKIEEINGGIFILQKAWDKEYQNIMDKMRDWLKENHDEILQQYNEKLFMDEWNKYAKGTISAWEMESLCFYYHEHELAKVDRLKYGISNFFNLQDSEVEYFFNKGNKKIPIYKIHRIIGTVISKNDNHASINLLTPDGLVSVKFTKEYYAMFKRQLSEKQEDGTKKRIEEGWFKRGTKLLVCGYRRGENEFVNKTYKKTGSHQLYKIEVENETDLILTHERWGQN